MSLKYNNQRQKLIWIDLDNSPHVPFFHPIIRELSNRGYPVMLSARDCFQVCGLADIYKLDYTRVGRHYGKNKALKIVGLFLRSMQMVPFVLRQRPQLAISHGSRSQTLVAALLRIPSIEMLDYEYVQGLLFVHPNWIIAPEVIPNKVIHSNIERIRKYQGIKEDVYVDNFTPDPKILIDLGIDGEDLVVTVRPPATEAHYHASLSDVLFSATLDFLVESENVRIVVLPRDDRQAEKIKQIWPKWSRNGKIIVPESPVNGLNLIWHSDLVISGGGTMNREAAALGVPVYSIFGGKTGAVDRYLSDTGRLTLIETVDQISKQIVLSKRNHPPIPRNGFPTALHEIMDILDEIMNRCHCKVLRFQDSR